MPPNVPTPTHFRIVIVAVLAVLALLVLRFVFAIALGLLKWLALGAVVALVVWLVLSKGDGRKSSS